MNYSGLIIGIATFFCIGIFHPIVIKAEYYFGTACWWAFALLGIAACAGSLFAHNILLSIALGVLGFSCFWSIVELFQQRKRVERGWFPANPKRMAKKKDSE